jgi:glycine hydroxymethyltransferase
MKEKQMEQIAELIDAVIKKPEDEPSLKKVRKSVHALTEKFPLYS